MLIHAHNPEREPNSYYQCRAGAWRAARLLVARLRSRHARDRPGMREDRQRLLSSIIERERPAGIVVCRRRCRTTSSCSPAHEAGGRARWRRYRRASRARRSFPLSESTSAAGGRCARHLSDRRLAIAASAFIEGAGRASRGSASLRRLPRRTARGRHCTASRGPRPATSPSSRASKRPSALLRERRSVTALACANDDMAAGAMLALHRAGLEIPSDDFGHGLRRYADVGNRLAAADDGPAADQVFRRAGRPHAVRASAATQGLITKPLPHELIVRESTAAPAQHSRA